MRSFDRRCPAGISLDSGSGGDMGSTDFEAQRTGDSTARQYGSKACQVNPFFNASELLCHMTGENSGGDFPGEHLPGVQ